MPRKIIVLFIISLFFGACIIPAINANNTVLYDDSNEIKVEFCSLEGVKNYTIMLSDDEMIELNSLLKSVNNRLDSAITREEGIDIYKDMFDSLEDLGFFNQGVSRQEAESMACRLDRETTIGLLDDMFENVSDEIPSGLEPDKSIGEIIYENKSLDDVLEADSNLFCLLHGTDGGFDDGTYISSLIQRISIFIVAILGFYFWSLMLVVLILLLYFDIKPIQIGVTISVGGVHYDDYGYPYGTYPGIVNYTTNGLNGKKIFDGKYYGNIPKIQHVIGPDYPGVSGYTGLNIYTWSSTEEDYTRNLFGSAILIRLSTSVPDASTEKPVILSSEPSGKTLSEHKYTFTTTDPQDDDIYYCIDWNDNSDNQVIGPYKSGEVISAYHSWVNPGNYEVKIKAIDSNYYESEWSNPLTVTITKSRALNLPLLRFLQQYPLLYQLFQRLLKI